MKTLLQGSASSFFAVALIAFLAQLFFGGWPLIGWLVSFIATPVMMLALFGGIIVVVKQKMITA